jgi:uncharacterized protein (DUF433 family)
MPAAAVSRKDEVEPAEGRIMNDEIAVMVAAAVRLPAAGETMEQIIESHPRLTSEQIRAALAYAAESLACSVALAEDWDRKLEADIREGRIDGLAEEAIEDLSEGRCTELPGQPESPIRDDKTEPR